jgi:hypothetical protein
MFQSAVNAQIGFGVVGELAYEGPLRAQPGILDSADPADNVIGRAFSIKAGATGSWAAGSAGAADPKPIAMEAGGAGPFGGILANPKVYTTAGTALGGSLAPSMTLPNDTVAEFVTETPGIVVEFPAATNPGDWVYYLQADGTLVTTAPGAAQPADSVGPIGVVARFVATSGNIGVLELHSDSTRAEADAE